MSQSGIYDQSTSGPDIETLTGNSGGAVSPDGLFNINIVGDTADGISVVGNPGTNTLTINSTADPQFLSATVTTNDATPTPIITIPIANDTAYILWSRVIGFSTAGAVGGMLQCCVRNNAGVLSVVNAVDFLRDDESLPTAAYTGVTSGTDLVIQVTGVAATTIYWKFEGNFSSVGP